MEVELWIMRIATGVLAVFVGFFLRQVYSQIQKSAEAGREGRKEIFSAIKDNGRDVDARLLVITSALAHLNGKVQSFETWTVQHEKLDMMSHQEHTDRLREHGERLTRIEYGERRATPRSQTS